MASLKAPGAAQSVGLTLALLAALLACSPFQQTSVQGPSRLIVLPDDSSDHLLSLLRQAKYSIDVVVYLLSSREVLEELAAAQQRGIRVRVLLEQNPVGGGESNRLARQQLAAAGVAVQWADPAFRFTHAKVILIDSARVAIMTLNLTASTFRSNRDFAVIVEDPSVVTALAALIASDWERVPPPEFALPLVISPVNARRELQDLIDSARQSLEVYVLSLEDDAIAAALAAAAERGVRVRMITNPPSGDDGYADERRLVRASGGYIGFLGSPDVHAKVVIVDGQRAFVGSQNFTATSLDQNREIGIIIASPDVLRRLLQTFEADWSQVMLEAFSAQMPAAAA